MVDVEYFFLFEIVMKQLGTVFNDLRFEIIYGKQTNAKKLIVTKDYLKFEVLYAKKKNKKLQ